MDKQSTSGPPGMGDGSPPEEGGSSYLYLNQSRRGFLTGLAKVSLGATALMGGLVGFVPTAIAQGTSPQYPCCPDGGCIDNPATIPAGTCMETCTGLCVSPQTNSCCYYWPAQGYYACAECYSGCPSKTQVKASCNSSDHSGYYCAIAC